MRNRGRNRTVRAVAAVASGCMRSAVAQKAFDPVSEIERCDLALPDREHAPSQAFEGAACLGVAFDVPGELRLPVRPVRRRLPLTEPTSVLVPEAPVDEQDRAMFRQHQVRRARQIAAVEAKSVTEPVDEAPDDDFGTRVRGPNARHDGATLCRRVSISHSWPPAAFILSCRGGPGVAAFHDHHGPDAGGRAGKWPVIGAVCGARRKKSWTRGSRTVKTGRHWRMPHGQR